MLKIADGIDESTRVYPLKSSKSLYVSYVSPASGPSSKGRVRAFKLVTDALSDVLSNVLLVASSITDVPRDTARTPNFVSYNTLSVIRKLLLVLKTTTERRSSAEIVINICPVFIAF